MLVEKKKDYTKMYVECMCKDFDHLTQFVYNKDDKNPWMDNFEIEFRTLKFDRGCHVGKFHSRIKSYFINLWHAIKGRPNQYSSMAEWDLEGAKEIRDFLNECIEEASLRALAAEKDK